MIFAVATESYVTIILAGLLAIAGTVVANWLGRRKMSAEAEDSEASAAERFTRIAISMIEPLEDQVVELNKTVASLRESRTVDEKKIQELEGRLEAVEAWARLLFAQVIEAGKTPMTFEESEALRKGA